MEISLGKFQKFIDEQMATGLYDSVNDIVNEALTLLVHKKKRIPKERWDALNEDIKKGEEDILAGRYSDGHEFFKELIAKYEV